MMVQTLISFLLTNMFHQYHQLLCNGSSMNYHLLETKNTFSICTMFSF